MVSEQLHRVSEWLMVKASGDAPITAAEAMHMSQVLAEIAGVAESMERVAVPHWLRRPIEEVCDGDRVVPLFPRRDGIGHRPPGDAA